MPVSQEAKRKHKFRYVPIAIVLVVGMVGFSLVKEYLRSYQIHSEIEQLRNQITALQTENKQAGDFVEYLKTESYFEQQARIKLGLKSPGEKMIVIDTSGQVGATGEHAVPRGAMALQTFQRDDRTNPQKWFDYFFGKE